MGTREFKVVGAMIADVRKMYEEDPRAKRFNALIMGRTGTGKTHLLTTCRKPVLLHSFDPGGSLTRALQPDIKKGNIVVDNRFEEDSVEDPRAWVLWERTFRDLRAKKAFNYFGTYAVDGLTSAGEVLMNQIVKVDTKNTTGIPQLQNYLRQQITLVNMIRQALMLPCDVIFTGHIGTEKDEVTGTIVTALFVSGKLVIKIPLLFDEVYVTQVRRSSSGSSYGILTTNDGLYQARTRMGGGVFLPFEEPDIKALLKKAGKDYEDKPSFEELEKLGEEEADA